MCDLCGAHVLHVQFVRVTCAVCVVHIVLHVQFVRVTCVTCAVHIVLHVRCGMCYMCGIGCHMCYIIMNALV